MLRCARLGPSGLGAPRAVPGPRWLPPDSARGRLRYARPRIPHNLSWWNWTALASESRSQRRAATSTDTSARLVCLGAALGSVPHISGIRRCALESQRESYRLSELTSTRRDDLDASPTQSTTSSVWPRCLPSTIRGFSCFLFHGFLAQATFNQSHIMMY